MADWLISLTDSQPTFSVEVGVTVSPKPFESIRVDIGYHNVSADGLEAALREGQPVVERLFGQALLRVQDAVEGARAGLYPDGTQISNAFNPSDLQKEYEEQKNDPEVLAAHSGFGPLGGAPSDEEVLTDALQEGLDAPPPEDSDGPPALGSPLG